MKQEFDDHGRGYWFCPKLDKKKDSGDPNGPDTEERHPVLKADANLISSKCLDGEHRPVLDFDIPARYVPSSTAGHGHLYIDKPMSWENYQILLRTLKLVGILEPGYVDAALRRGATFVRPPGVLKPEEMLAEPHKYKTSKDRFLKVLAQKTAAGESTEDL
jgi:hypothetical protein